VSLTYDEARTRAEQVSDVTYRIDLDLSSRETFGCRTTVTFALADPRATTFLELKDAQEQLLPHVLLAATSISQAKGGGG